MRCADWRARSGSTGVRRRGGVRADHRGDGRRGPDGCGLWARGPVALGHRRLSIIDLSAAGSQPMVDPPLGLTVVFNGCIYNYQALRAELDGARAPVLLPLRHRGDPQGVRPVGHRLRRPLPRHVRLRHRRARVRAAGAGPGPAGHQAALPRPDGRPAAVRLDPARAAGRRRHRHLDRPDRAGVLHDLPQRRAGAADHPERHPQAAAGDHPGGRARRHVDRPRLLEARLQPRPGPGGLDEPGLAGGAAGQPADRGRPADGGRRPGRGAAVRRHRLLPGRRPAGRGRAARTCRPSASASTPPAASRATSSSTPRWSPSASAPTTTGSRSTARGCCPASTRPSPR